MSGKRYTDEFKDEAIRQVTERGHPAREVVTCRLLHPAARVELTAVGLLATFAG